ncbi:cation efflux family-domain-containing protein [Jimgerdemannia flammicorona]|uniref:Cation efflux family-domain-containing protein n=1 Tax=Jimgerdemannia flammicorona TaxID=994334 RepID=A0A433Q735_9FUNG|nr:cation efflux family-domain-containing protein [Jimgerdemannia flammicorona]
MLPTTLYRSSQHFSSHRRVAFSLLSTQLPSLIPARTFPSSSLFRPAPPFSLPHTPPAHRGINSQSLLVVDVLPVANFYLQRRHHGTHGKPASPAPRQHDHHDHDGHKHGGHTHSHFATSLTESSKRGTRITLIGLGANVGLTVMKGVAGWLMNSASLVADAAHSLSGQQHPIRLIAKIARSLIREILCSLNLTDLLSDFVTLYTFRVSRKPADDNHPYGYGKYETVGSLAVSSFLITGAIGIGWHSYDLLLGVLTPEMYPTPTPDAATAALPVIAAASTAESTIQAAGATGGLLGHHHHDSGALNPNAAWFALTSVLVKEWLYRATMKVGIDEKSSVLVANAWHHRSDAFSSVVALGAIGGSYMGAPILDPVGGILVAGMIMKSGVEIMLESLKELVDVGIEEDVVKQVEAAIRKVKGSETNIIDFHSIRGRKAGPFLLVDLVLQVNPDLTVSKAHHVEEVVRRAVKQQCQQVKEVLIHLDAEKEPPHP